VIVFGDILQKFVAKSPATVMVRGLLERLLNPEALDRWFEATAQAQYTRDILFSSLVGLMLQIVCRTRASVHAAYRHAAIAASIVSVYAKLRGVELTTSQGLVRHLAGEARMLIESINGQRPAQLPGYRLKYLDGNCPAASEHRLKPLRTTGAGALPGKSLVVFDPQPGLAVDVFPCADGHARERSLLGAVAETVQPGEVWVADRNFCVSGFLHAIHQRQAFFHPPARGPHHQAVGADAAGGQQRHRGGPRASRAVGFARGRALEPAPDHRDLEAQDAQR
jgi:hypothetical protein